MVRGVTFDFWQTLFYDPNEPQRMRVRAAGMADALAARGIHRPPATVLRAILDCGRHRLAIDQEREFAPFNQVTWILGRLGLAPDEMPPCLLAAVAAPYCEAGLTVPPVVFPAASATLAELSQRYPLALICNTGASPGAVLRTVLFRAGLLGFFKATVFSDEIGWRKPHRLAFETAATFLGVPLAQCVHIGDDPWTDGHGAKAAGMQAILLAGGEHGNRPHRSSFEDRRRLPDAEVAGLGELRAALLRLEAPRQG